MSIGYGYHGYIATQKRYGNSESLLTKLVEGGIIVALIGGQGLRTDVSCRSAHFSFGTADIRRCLVAKAAAEELLRALGLSGGHSLQMQLFRPTLTSSQVLR